MSRLRSTLETRHELALGSRARVPPQPTLAPRGTRSRSIGRKVIAGVLGGVGGFFVGGMVGAAIEGNSCACDDPGLTGVVIGAPIRCGDRRLPRRETRGTLGITKGSALEIPQKAGTASNRVLGFQGQSHVSVRGSTVRA